MTTEHTRVYVSAFVTNMENGNLDSGLDNLAHINQMLRDHEVNDEAEVQNES